MMDVFTFLNDPFLFYPVLAIIILVPVILMLTRPKGENTILIERVRPHYNIIRGAKQGKSPNPGDTVLSLPDKRKFIVPKEVEENVEVVEVPKNVTIKKGFRKLWFVENNQVVKLADTLVEAATTLITPEMIPTLLNRGSLKRLASGKLGGVQSWTMLLLAGAAAFAVGYIMYPQFNHPATVVEYCSRAINGSISGCSLIP